MKKKTIASVLIAIMAAMCVFIAVGCGDDDKNDTPSGNDGDAPNVVETPADTFEEGDYDWWEINLRDGTWTARFRATFTLSDGHCTYENGEQGDDYSYADGVLSMGDAEFEKDGEYWVAFAPSRDEGFLLAKPGVVPEGTFDGHPIEVDEN